VECVRLLLRAGADPNALVDGTAETALHGCIIGLGTNVTESDRHQVVKLLIEHGADPNRRTIPRVQTLAF
jgi:ankyrin repeat protein